MHFLWLFLQGFKWYGYWNHQLSRCIWTHERDQLSYSFKSANQYRAVIVPLIVWFSVCLSLLFNLTSFTMRNWALACWSRLSCSDWLMLVKMPTSGLKCNTLPWRFVRKWPKLRMQHTRTTHWRAWRKRDIKKEHERMQNTWMLIILM